LGQRQQASKNIHTLKAEVDVQRNRVAMLDEEARLKTERFEKQREQQSKSKAAEEQARAAAQVAEELAQQAARRAERAEQKVEEQAAEVSALLEQLKQQLTNVEREASEGVERVKREASAEETRLQSELAEVSARTRQNVEVAEMKAAAAHEAESNATLDREVAQRELLLAQEEIDCLRDSCSGLESTGTSWRASGAELAREVALVRLSTQRLQKEVEDAHSQASEARQRLARVERETQSAKEVDPMVSGLALSSEPEIAGVEEHTDDPSARGDVSEEFAEKFEHLGCRQAFRIGRVRLHTVSEDEVLCEESFPLCYSVVVLNSGSQPWPATVALVHASGNAMDMPLLSVGPLQPGESTQLVLDLRVPHTADPQEPVSTSMWVLRDAATGKPLGPVLLFDVQWKGKASS